MPTTCKSAYKRRIISGKLLGVSVSIQKYLFQSCRRIGGSDGHSPNRFPKPIANVAA